MKVSDDLENSVVKVCQPFVDLLSSGRGNATIGHNLPIRLILLHNSVSRRGNTRINANDPSHLFCLNHKGFVHIEVGGNFLNIVMIFKSIHEFQQPSGVIPIHFDTVLGNHDHLGALDIKATLP